MGGQRDESCIEESPPNKETGASVVSRQQIKINDPTTSIMGGNIQLRTLKDLKPIKPSYQIFNVDEALKITNGIVQLINNYAGQLFEMHNNIFKLIVFKPRRVYKHLAREYQNRIERSYGENILRHVVFT